MSKDIWEVIVSPDWGSEWTYAICDSEERAVEKAENYVAQVHPQKWGIRLNEESGDHQVLRQASSGSNWVRIRHLRIEQATSTTNRPQRPHVEGPGDLPYFVRIPIVAGVAMLLRYFTLIVLPGTELEVLIWPLYVLFLAWVFIFLNARRRTRLR